MLPIYARVFACLPSDIPRILQSKSDISRIKIWCDENFYPAFWKGILLLRIFEGKICRSWKVLWNNISKIVSRVNKINEKSSILVSLIFKVSEQRSDKICIESLGFFNFEVTVLYFKILFSNKDQVSARNVHRSLKRFD